MKKTIWKMPRFDQMMRALPLEEPRLADNYFLARTNDGAHEPIPQQGSVPRHNGLRAREASPKEESHVDQEAPLIGIAALALSASGALAQGKGPVVGVSWSNFQEERWKTDEAAIKAAVEKAGGTYVSADAQSSPAKQLTDIESLISQGAKALIVLAQDSEAVRPAVQKAVDEGIAVVGYDRLIENPQVFYLTFDNNEVGRMEARDVLKVKPEGNYVFIKGSGCDPERQLPVPGSMEVLKPAIDSRQDQECRRGLYGRLAPRQRAAEHGAVPDQEQQQGRCGRRRQ